MESQVQRVGVGGVHRFRGREMSGTKYERWAGEGWKV